MVKNPTKYEDTVGYLWEPQDEVVLESFKVQEVKHYKARCVWIFEF